MSPLISIALCTYNGALYLPEQMDSLLAQNWDNLEIVAVDDGSTDGTRDILQDYVSRDHRISLHLNDRNLGFFLNFEKAISLTRGEFIAPCDQDDWWHPDKLRGLYEAIGDHALAYCDSLLVDQEGRSLDRRISDVSRMYEGVDPSAFLFANCVSGHAMLFRRSLLANAMPFPTGMFHDWWLAFVAASTEGLVFIPQPWVKYRQHGATQTDPLGRDASGRRKRPRWEELNQYEAWITCLAGFPSPHQPYFQSLLKAWTGWCDGWLGLELVHRLFERRNAIYFIRGRSSQGAIKRAFRFFWGLKLKRILFPSRYVPPRDHRA